MSDIRRYVITWRERSEDTTVHVAAYNLEEAKEQSVLGLLRRFSVHPQILAAEPYEEALHGPWLGRGGIEPKAALRYDSVPLREDEPECCRSLDGTERCRHGKIEG